MSPLIEEARRRQRRRRIALGVLILTVAVAAGLAALFHRAPSPGRRQAQPKTWTYVARPVPLETIVRLHRVAGRVVLRTELVHLKNAVELRLTPVSPPGLVRVWRVPARRR